LNENALPGQLNRYVAQLVNETPNIWKLRVARRLLIAEQELLKQAEAHSELVSELIGSAVADWTLAQCKLANILTDQQESPPTSVQLENLRHCGLIDHDQFDVLSTAYRARNLAHHEQIGLEFEQSVQLLNAVSWALHNPVSSETNAAPFDRTQFLRLMREVQRLSRAGGRRKPPKQIVMALFQDSPFNSDWGPNNFELQERIAITQSVAKRGMLAGVLRNLHWPLVSCDICKTITSVDNCVTPQEECMSESAVDRFEAFCVWGCSQAHRETVSKWIAKESDGIAWEGYQYLQNTVQMIRIGLRST
jgi:hypothetical protein